MLSLGFISKHAEDLAPLTKVLSGPMAGKLNLDRDVNIKVRILSLSLTLPGFVSYLVGGVSLLHFFSKLCMVRFQSFNILMGPLNLIIPCCYRDVAETSYLSSSITQIKNM